MEIEGIVFTHEHNLQFDKLNDFINQKIEFKDDVYEDCDYGSENFKSLLWIKSNSHLKNIAVLCAECYAVTFSNGETVFENSEVFHSYDHSLFMVESSKPRILNCIISNSRSSGIYVADNSNPKLKNCEIYNHQCLGIGICKNATGKYSDCDIHDNGYSGLSSFGNPMVENCKIHENSEWGIDIMHDTYGIYKNCTIYGNEYSGISNGSDDVDISSCHIYNNGWDDDE